MAKIAADALHWWCALSPVKWIPCKSRIRPPSSQRSSPLRAAAPSSPTRRAWPWTPHRIRYSSWRQSTPPRGGRLATACGLRASPFEICRALKSLQSFLGHRHCLTQAIPRIPSDRGHDSMGTADRASRFSRTLELFGHIRRQGCNVGSFLLESIRYFNNVYFQSGLMRLNHGHSRRHLNRRHSPCRLRHPLRTLRGPL